MRRKRLTLSVLLILFLFLSFYHSWNLIQINENVKKRLLARVAPYIGGEFSIDRVSLGLGSLHIKGIEIRNTAGGRMVYVRDLKIRISLLKLIRTRFDFTKSVNRIEINRPQVVLSGLSRGAGPARPRETSPGTTGWPIDSLIVRRGTLTIGDSILKFLDVRNIFGTLVLGPDSNRLSLSGIFLNAGKNIQIKGSADPGFRTYELALELMNASLKQSVDLGEILSIKQGDIDLAVRLKSTGASGSVFPEMTGALALRNGLFSLPGGLSVSAIRGHIRLEKHMAGIDSFAGVFLERPLTLRGTIDSLPFPRLDLELAVPRINLAHKQLAALPSAPSLSGTASLNTRISGRIPDIEAEISLNSKQIRFRGNEFRNPDMALHYRKDTLYLTEFTPGVAGGNVQAAGFCRVKAPYAYKIMASGKNVDLPALLSPATKRHPSAIDFSGELTKNGGTPVFAFKLNGDALGMPALRAFSADVRTRDNKVVVKAGNGSKTIRIKGEIDAFSLKPEAKLDIQARNLKLSDLCARSDSCLFPESLLVSSDGSITGPLGRLKVHSRMTFTGEPVKGAIMLEGAVSSLFDHPETALKIHSDRLTLFSLQGPLVCRLAWKKDDLSVRNLEFRKSVTGFLSLQKKNLAGELKINNLDISACLDVGVDKPNIAKPGGLIKGTVKLDGSVSSPGIRADLALRNGRIGHLTDLAAHLKMTHRLGVTEIHTFNLETPQNRFVRTKGLSIGPDGVTGSIKVEKLNLSDLFKKGTDLEGALYLDFQGKRPGHSVLTATLDGFRYKQMRLAYARADIQEANGRARIKQMSFGNSSMAFNASGFFTLPYAFDKEKYRDTASITLTFKGDLLQMLAGLSGSSGRSSRANTCRGQGLLNITGPLNNLKIENGYLDFSKDPKASLSLEKIFPNKMTKFKCYAGVYRGAVSLEVSGAVQGRELHIINIKDYGNSPHLLLDALGLDFGVLKVTAEKGGVPVHLAFLFPENEYGEFELFDRNGQPGIIITGPLKHPRVIGQMRVHNVRFTYPFLVDLKHGGGDNPARDIDWEMTILAGNNFKYFYNYKKKGPLPFLDKLFKNKTISKSIDKGISGIFEYPFTELTLDKTSYLHLHGVPGSGGFKLTGRITSSRGYVHHYTIDYNRDVDVGVEFDGSEILPVIWGSATAVIRSADKSRMDNEMTLTLYVKDPVTGAPMKKGRFHDISLVPSSDIPFNENGEPVDAYQEILGRGGSGNLSQAMTDVAKSEGKAMFEKIVLQRLVTNYLERTILGFGRENINPLLGMNVTPDVLRIEIESDKVFNYIDMSIWNFDRIKRDILENVEFITGKYFLGGSLFLNYSSQFDLTPDPEGIEIEKLHHRVGVEIMPWRYLYFDLDYEIGAIPHAIGGDFNTSDVRSNIRLKIPLKKFQNLFIREKP